MRVRRKQPVTKPVGGKKPRAGISTLDYVLVLCIVLPLATIVIPTGMRMIALVYDMIAVTISWPFL